jgi:hypothetical protein
MENSRNYTLEVKIIDLGSCRKVTVDESNVSLIESNNN